MTEEVVSVDLNYSELWTLLESGTIKEDSALSKKLRAARGAFERSPKVYGKGLAIKFRDNYDSITYNDPNDSL